MENYVKKWEPFYYDENCILQYRTATAMLQNISLTGKETILDVGSGSGKITYHISQLTFKGKVVGLDISSAMVEFAKTNYKAQNLTFLQKDILEMKYQNCFDMVVSFWTLSWVDNQVLALKNIVASLKPGGKMLLMYPMRHDAYNIADEMIKYPRWKKYFDNVFSPRPFITESEYRGIINSISEASMTVAQKEIPCHFESYIEMQASIRSWMSYLDNLPEEKLKKEFLKEFTEKYINYRKETTPVMYFNILEIRGVKLELTPKMEGSSESCSRIRAKL